MSSSAWRRLSKFPSVRRQTVHQTWRGTSWAVGIRAQVEHPFRVLKRQFGFTKVRYRGLAKNAAQIATLLALSNLWMARRQLKKAQG